MANMEHYEGEAEGEKPQRKTVERKMGRITGSIVLIEIPRTQKSDRRNSLLSISISSSYSHEI